MSSAPEASSLHLREGSSEQPLAEPPTSTQLESSLACATATSSGTPSDLDASSQQQQGSKERRKVGLSWTEAEHRQFLQGLEKLGKGDWRGISRQFVTTRTPTQVASHAQKYYIRQTNQNRRKRRASLFDLANPEGHAQARSSPPASQATAAAAASDGEQFFSRAESSRATMPAEVSQSVAPSHSESLNCLQSRLASAPDSATQSLPSSSLACCHSSASDPRDVSQPKAHEQAEFPAPSPFGGPSDQPATFANGKLHRPVAARPTLHGLVPPPMFMADDPNQCSGGSSMTQSLRPHP
ncbi:hypothetical protein WJX84_005425 [Apatococcus fuscideae]|uniref:Uncharacterized protein n=1 Tax=Apatococcus fuscideae TaxID=2026836 RepID=A0AAW1SS88_9CHLO